MRRCACRWTTRWRSTARSACRRRSFLLAVQQLLYDRELYPILPLLVDRVRQRDAASLRNLAAQLLTQTRRGDRVDVVAAFECGQAGTAADEAQAVRDCPRSCPS